MREKPYLIGIAGPSCSGKSSLAHHLAALLQAVIIPLDSYYRDLSGFSAEERARRNFDDPEALDWDLMLSQLTRLAEGEAVDKPVYQFSTHTRAPEPVLVRPASFIIVEGLFALHREEIRRLFQIGVFVNLDDQTCLSRRLHRDTCERGRTVESITWQYLQTVRPMAERYILPTQIFADLLLDGSGTVADMAGAVMDQFNRGRGLLSMRTAAGDTQ